MGEAVLGRRLALGLSGAALLGPLSRPARAQAGGDIVLGGVFALTGPVRLITEPYEQGARAYFNRVNKQGGVGGRPIRWVVEDDAYQPARALAGAKKLIERDKVAFLFGQFGTPPMAAIAPYAEQAKVPFFCGTPAIQPMRQYTFGFMSGYPDEMYELVKYFVGPRGFKRIAYLYQNDDLGEVARTGIDRAMKESGLDLVENVGYERGTNDFGTHILKLKAARPDAVISIGTAPIIATGIKQGRAMGFTPVWATYGVGSSNVMQSLLGADIEGLMFATEVLDQFSDDPAVQEVKADLKASFPDAKADYATMVGYGQARMIVEVLKAAGPDPTREKVLEVAQSGTPFPVGIMAPVHYNKDSRSGASALRIFEWKGGTPQPRTDWLPIRR